MNNEQIQAWARECDLNRVCGPLGTLLDYEWDCLQRFATLARADLVEEVERLTEQCKLFDAAAYKTKIEAQTLVDAAQAEVERERLRLAACGVAALGYFDGCKDEYRSGSLDDVLKIRAEVESLKADALRYQWLRDNSNAIHWTPSRFNKEIVSGFSFNGTGYLGFKFEEAIDAAMKGTP
jgi:hypothetical protein